MNSRQLKIEVRRLLLTHLEEAGLGDYRVLAEYQPTAQGRDRNAIYFFEVSSNRHGWQKRAYKVPADGWTGGQVESQAMQTVLQFGAFAAAGQEVTSEDLLNNAALIMNGLKFAEDARSVKIGVQRITDIRTPHFKNEFDRFEMSPSFDVTFSYTRTLEPSVEFLNTITPAVHRI